jgi:hypothetical protein
MSILQNKLVWKSIEALHDEAVAAPVDAASDTLVIKSYPAATLHTAPIDPDDHAGDVMTRIDNLLQQLGADDAISKNAPENASKNLSASAPPHLPQDLNVRSEIDEEEMAETQTAITHTAIIADITAETELPEADPASSAGGLQDTVLGENLGDASPANHSPADHSPADDAFGGDSSEADTALADIAAAIDQARQQSAQVRSSEPMAFDDNDTKAAEAPIDFDALTAKLVDEMRDTVSTMIATELPTMVRQAVTDAFKDLPVAAIDLAAKTAISKKAAPKKPASKKMAKKNTNGKKTASKKAAGKKVAPKKAI